MVLFGTNLFQIVDCVAVPTFCHFVDLLWMFLEKSIFKNLSRINCLGSKSVQFGRIHFTFTKIMNKLISTKNRVFILSVVPSETEKSQLFYKWLKIATFQPKFDKMYFFINILNLFTMLCRRKLKISSLCKEKSLNLLNR